VDLTLVDESGIEIDMGSPIDELSGRSHPDYFRDRPEGQHFHHHREILNRVMSAAGFERHPGEWWHFSFGDQMWAWQIWQRAGEATLAQYGRVD
jgi:D-alanyl-D-alanine dipeptidase